MDWDPTALVVWKNAKLLTRPEMTTRQVKGIETPQRFGRAEFSIESNGEVRHISIGSHYWDTAVSQFSAIKGDIVDVTFLPHQWVLGNKFGTKYYFYKIEEN